MSFEMDVLIPAGESKGKNAEMFKSIYRRCSVKKLLLELQKKLDHLKNLKGDVGYLSNDLVRCNILDQAKMLSAEISEIHDKKADCRCFQESNVLVGIENSNKTNERMNQLIKLQNLLKQLDGIDLDSNKKSLKSLNPLSKCFVPKLFATENHPEKSLIPENGTKKIHIPLKYQKRSKSQYEMARPYEKFNKYKEIKTLWCSKAENRIAFNYSSQYFSDVLSVRPTLIGIQSNKFSSIWSVCLQDRKLFNPRVVDKPCGCPPSFGYNIPFDIFGRKQFCSESGIHANYYLPLNYDGYNDFEKNPSKEFPPYIFEPTQDTDEIFSGDDKFHEFRLNGYKKDFEKFVSEICDFTEYMESTSEPDEGISLSDEDRTPESKSSNQQPLHLAYSKKDGEVSNYNQENSFRDNFGNELLDNFSRCNRLRRRYFRYPETVYPNCNPPCSTWCNSKTCGNSDKCSKTWGWNRQRTVLSAHKHLNKTHTYESKDVQDSGDGTILDNQNVSEQSSQIKVPGSIDVPEASGSENCRRNARSRHSSIDSGYDSSAHSWDATWNVSNPCVDGSIDFESEYWKPLPDCNTRSQENSIRRNKFNGGSNRRPLKVQKNLVKRSFQVLEESEEQDIRPRS